MNNLIFNGALDCFTSLQHSTVYIFVLANSLLQLGSSKNKQTKFKSREGSGKLKDQTKESHFKGDESSSVTKN